MVQFPSMITQIIKKDYTDFKRIGAICVGGHLRLKFGIYLEFGICDLKF